MLPIQQVGKEISSNPKSMYFFTGLEYGVKLQYIDILSKYYSSDIEEHPSLNKLLETFRQKSIIPRKPKVYVVRYDSEFIQSLSPERVSSISKLKIAGTIVGIYEEEKHEAKLDKCFPDSTVRINTLPDSIAFKHLSKMFDIPESYIHEAIRISANFYQAQLICNSMCMLPTNSLHSMSRKDIESLFGFEIRSDNQRFKLAIASRDYTKAIHEIDNYGGDINLLFYDILSTFLELVKLLDKPYLDSFVKPYVKFWDYSEIKKFYNVTYSQLEQLRNFSSYSSYVSLLYICGLLQFKLS